MRVLDLGVMGLLTAGVAWVATPLVGRLARRLGVLDLPAGRKLHRAPTPLLGGLALWLAVLVGFACSPAELLPERWGLALALTLVAAAGLWDDVRGLSVGGKLVAQLAAAGLAGLSGIRLELGMPQGIELGLTLGVLILFTNAWNLLDNMDGAATTVALAAALGLALLAVEHGVPATVLLAVVWGGAALGFLPSNFPPARLFMGDAGSQLLGLGLGLTALGLQPHLPARGAGLALVLAIPLFDTALVTWSRLRQGKNPLTTPGQDHVAHRLLRAGLTPRQVLLGFASLGVGLDLLALGSTHQ